MSYKVMAINVSNRTDLQLLLNSELARGWEMVEIGGDYIVFKRAATAAEFLDGQQTAEHLQGNIDVALEHLKRCGSLGAARWDEMPGLIAGAIKWLERTPDPDAVESKKAPWKDKQGESIYEGDTVRWDTGRHGVVVYNLPDGWRVRCEGDNVNPSVDYVGLQAAAPFLTTLDDEGHRDA